MASPKCQYKYFVLALLLATFVFINPALCDEPTQLLIDKICRKMEEYAFCNNTFHQNLKSPNADIVALTQITIEQASTNATNIRSFVSHLLETTNDPAERKALATCEIAYHKMMVCFSDATMAFFRQDYYRMLEYEKPAPREQASCTEIFNTPPNPPNPVGDKNRQMRILIAMAIAAGIDLTSSS